MSYSDKTWKEIEAGLSAPFSAHELEVRPLRSGINKGGIWVAVHFYVTNRAVQNRFDEVVGAANWRESYVPVTLGNETGFLCSISVRDPEHTDEWITKQDGASLTDIELQVESVNLVLTINSSRQPRSRLNLFGQGGIYFADTRLSGPFDSVSEDSNGFLLAAGVEVMINHNFSVKAEAYNLFDVEDFADDESISIFNLGGQFVF